MAKISVPFHYTLYVLQNGLAIKLTSVKQYLTKNKSNKEKTLTIHPQNTGVYCLFEDDFSAEKRSRTYNVLV